MPAPPSASEGQAEDDDDQDDEDVEPRDPRGPGADPGIGAGRAGPRAKNDIVERAQHERDDDETQLPLNAREREHGTEGVDVADDEATIVVSTVVPVGSARLWRVS